MTAGHRFWIAVCMALLLAVAWVGSVAQGQTAPGVLSHRDQMTLRMVQMARAGRLAEAREVLRSFLAENPTDGAMFYNLACLDLLLREKDQALADLEEALANGYTNFRLMEADRDLGPLRDDPRFLEMVARHEEEFRREFLARALSLDEGYPAAGIALPQPSAAAAGLPRPTAQVGFDAAALRVTLTVQDPGFSAGPAPWEGGCGVLVNLVHPISPDDYESRRYFSYAFFGDGERPRAALVGRHGQVLLQPEPDLAPVITRQDGFTTYAVTIPWERFTPYAPPLDEELGLNIFYLGAGSGGSRPVFALMGEDRLSFEPSPWRRYVPVVFQTSDRTGPVMRGRLYNRLALGDSVGVQLAFWSSVEGPARCRLSLHRPDDPAGAPLQPVTEEFPCETELNFFNTYVNLEGIPAGSWVLRATLTLPDGSTFTRDYPFDNLETDWIASLNQRVFALESPEQSILYYHLFALAHQAEARHPQDDASDLHRARAEVVRLLELVEAGGSCLPASGAFRGGFTSAVMTQRFCAMHLPPGHRDGAAPRLVMALPAEPGTEDGLARSLGEALAGQADAIVLVPQSHGHTGLAAGTAAEETILALQWARNLFPGGTVTLVGLGKGADAALETSLRRPDLCEAVVLEGDQLYPDLPGFSEEAVAEALGARPNGLPYTLAAGTLASPRLPVIAAAMQKLGLGVEIRPLGGPALDAAALAAWLAAGP